MSRHVIYCRGCRKTWHDDSTGFGDGECSCVCTDETAPHYEDWMIDPPPPGTIPEGVLE